MPLLFKEANKILYALANRGVDYRNGHLGAKIKALGLAVVPVFGASFNYATNLSDAMEARNLVPRTKRTKYRLYHGSVASWACAALLICLLALFIYLRVRKVIIYPCVAVDCFLV
ncbi:MAG: energy-coupling factor transporter transmembrane protein EcfT [Mycoplasmoidaceae bacterium]|nr:energy-coupling factor transporter transmembrane protein EcfT [Mycoplasmoidaceae bacterium]